MRPLPSGTVTFLFTDIEGSTRLAQQYPDSIAELLDRHHGILQSSIEAHEGYVFQIVGDAFCASFQAAHQALDAALEAQRSLAAQNWTPEPVRVRMGIGTGTAQVKYLKGRPPDYSGYLNLARVQRVMSLACGGQILLANASAELLRSGLPASVSLRDMGEQSLKSLLTPERIWQVVAPGLQVDFPPMQGLSLIGGDRPLEELRRALEITPLQYPSFLALGRNPEPPVFVTRERELGRLEAFLKLSQEDCSQVVFITGDPGQGKTALAREFARRAAEKCPGLAVAEGNCDPYTGIGDPYLPFREILGLLCGEVQARWDARGIGREQVNRLWQCMPIAMQSIAGQGRDLVGTFVSGDMLLRRASDLAASLGRGEWSKYLEQLARAKGAGLVDLGFRQSALFEQYLRVLADISKQRPLLLILDDLQWADSGSINLLTHLAKRLQASHVMILGTYRTAELALGRDNQRHPLEPILNELKRQYGQIEIDLGESDGRSFVDAFIDSEPNRLGEEFRATLFGVAGGHPLATIELLRDLQERGGVVRDASDMWVQGETLNWDLLPARVEAMIAERIERLDAREQRILRVAAVEGESFTAEVAARVLDEESATIRSMLSEDLERRHHLVKAQSVRQVDGHQLCIYRFQHHLFQRYLHDSLDMVERSTLHRSVGIALEELYARQPQEISGQLARQFQEAGTATQAADYLVQAGDRASKLYAHQEAIGCYQQAQQLYEQALGNRWGTLQRAILERKIGEALFLQGKNQQALEHLLRARGYLGLSLPRTQFAMTSALLREVIRQVAHRLLPQPLLRPSREPIGPEHVERELIAENLDWITAWMDPMFWLLLVLERMNDMESHGIIEGIAGQYGVFGLLAHMLGLIGVGEYYHGKSTALAEKMERPENVGEAHNWLALHENIEGRWEAALEHAQRAAEAYRSHWHMRGWAWAITSLADAHIHQGDFPAALQNSLELVKSGEERGDNQTLCWGHSRQGFALRGLGQLQEAASHLEKAMALARDIPDYQIGVDSGGELGHAYLRLGKLNNALQVYEECHHISTEHNLLQSPVRTRYLNGLAEAYLMAAELSGGLEKLSWLSKAERACADAVKQGKAYPPGLPETLMLRGTYEWLAGRPSEARRWWERSLALATELNESYDEGIAHLEIGLRLNDREHLERAVDILASIRAEWDVARAREGLTELG